MDLIVNHFQEFRKHIIGDKLVCNTPYGNIDMLYADWIASGRLYEPIEKILLEKIGPWVSNTHTESSISGQLMTKAYHYSHKIIKEHVNARESDVLITTGFGMTSALVKFQRILNLKYPNIDEAKKLLPEEDRPIVFITHMEHHSNQTSWYYTIADVEIIPPGENLLVDTNNLRILLEKYANRKIKIGSFTACSNVTGIKTPVHELARIMHEANGYCFIDYAASAPYVDINMHPENPLEHLDAIFFSPHKFLGGPGSSGVLIFNSQLYQRYDPDQPGGGTVDWTNPWGEFRFVQDIETREDGGTPGFIQSMRTALSIKLKEQLDTKKIHERESQLVNKFMNGLRKIPNVNILADSVTDRLGIVSFYIDNIHFNLVVKLLSDRFGIQVRGGCACAGTYGHYLLDVSYEKSKEITNLINFGDLSQKPGWIRVSLHPILLDSEVDFILDAIAQIQQHHEDWALDYYYDKHTNEFIHVNEKNEKDLTVYQWFEF